MVVQLASPYDAERIKQMAAQKARFQPNPGPVAAQKPWYVRNCRYYCR